MERERGIWSTLLTGIGALAGLLCSCAKQTDAERCLVTIGFEDHRLASKAIMPDECKISNVNLLVFDSYGQIVENIYRKDRNPVNINLIAGQTYSFAATANFGYKVNVSSLEDLSEIAFHLAYPDEYQEGMPMTSEIVSMKIDGPSDIRLTLVNMMAKISIRMDRRRLSDGVEMHVAGLRIGNCPKKALAFGRNAAKKEDDCFNVGFTLDQSQCSGLGRMASQGVSEEVSVYMFENMQGRFSNEDLTDDQQKIIAEDDPRFMTCSYIEMDIDYTSELWQSKEIPLTYRFYLGEDRNNLDIERNCHYHITVAPEDDGLHGDGWRVDKTGLQYTGPTLLEPYPSNYIVGNLGDKIHIGCRVTPSHAPFDVGLEYLEDDKATGIYDYIVDSDGHGVTLILTGPGTGLIYMEAGPPVNDGALFLVEVNTPK